MSSGEKRGASSVSTDDLDEPPVKRQRLSASSENSSTNSNSNSSSKEKTKDNKCQNTITGRDNSNSKQSNSQQIIFVTGNKGKLNEVRSFFDEKTALNIVNRKLDLEEIQGTPKEIIKAKLFEARKIVGNNVSILVQDTSLVLNAYSKNKAKESEKEKEKEKKEAEEEEEEEDDDVDSIDLLLGFPGPYIKWLLKWDKDKNEGLCKMARGLSDNSGYSLCIFGLLLNNSDKALYFSGKCDGIIPDKPKEGNYGFGWDCVFVPKKIGNKENVQLKSFAQMTLDEKMTISHNGIALTKLKNYLQNNFFK